MKKLNQTSFLKLPFLGDMAVSFGRTVFGIVLGLIASAVLIAISGVNPFLAYGALIRGAFGNAQALSNVLVRASPLLLGGIGVSLGIKAGVWNIGMEGYMYLGAIGASMVGILELGLPPFLHILICFLCAAAFSAVWGLIPGYLKAYKGVNEVTSTIMMSYIAIYLTNWVVSSFAPIAEIGKFYPMSKQFASTALLPILMKGSSLHPGPFLAILLCVIFYFILNYTSFGYRTKMLGANPNAAKYAGVDARKQIMLIIMIGAIIGGLSGAVEVMGLKRRVYMEFVTNVGYESVAVALLAAISPCIGVRNRYAMKKERRQAGNYLKAYRADCRFCFSANTDHLVNKTVTHIVIPKSNTGGHTGGGGGSSSGRSTTHSSGGRSFGGGGRKF